jgi:hypothetical protein
MCPESWRRHYIEGQKEPTSIALIFGSAVHDTIESYVVTGKDLAEIWDDKLTEQLDNTANVDWGTETAKSLANEGERILTAPNIISFIDGIRTGYNPKRERSIERRVELRIPGVPIPIIGYIDIILDDGVPADFKTAARMWPEDKAGQEMQPLVYLAALNQAGIHDHNWRFRHFVISKSAKPTAKMFSTQRSPGEVLTALMPTVCQVWRDIEGKRFPKITTGWKCSSKYCGYYADCQGK